MPSETDRNKRHLSFIQGYREAADELHISCPTSYLDIHCPDLPEEEIDFDEYKRGQIAAIIRAIREIKGIRQ